LINVATKIKFQPMKATKEMENITKGKGAEEKEVD